MAGGEGRRLRPMTANLPKPLLPVANRPIMEHVLRLLRRHGFDETVVTVQYLASLVRSYFGDGDELGMHLSYATEQIPLGTAGSVRNAHAALSSGAFLVISGDALTDIDLTALVEAHRSSGALVTACLARKPEPLEFGLVVQDTSGRIERFLEKPTWGQVFTDTVNTGIYVMEPEVFDSVEPGRPVDWAADVFPALLARGAPLHGHVADGYWEDVGSLASYAKVHADVLHRRVDVDVLGFQVRPGIWMGEGAEVHDDALLEGPLVVGDYTQVEARAELRPLTVLGNNVVVRSGAVLERAIVHHNAFVGRQVELRGCVIGSGTDVMRAVRVEEGAIVGDACLLEEEAFVSGGVLVYPHKTIDAGSIVHSSVVWENRGGAPLFGPRGVTGLVNVEMTPESVVRLASAYATTLPKGSSVVTSRDASRAARALKRAVIAALTASGIDVRDLEVAPLPVTRFTVANTGAAGGIVLRTSPTDAQVLEVVLLSGDGADLSPVRQRGIERVLSRREFRRAFPGEIAELTFPSRTVETYSHELLRSIDVSGVEQARLTVVLDTSGGAVSLVLPALLGRLGVDVLTLNARLDEAAGSEGVAGQMRAQARLAELVRSSGVSFGVRFDPTGERIDLVDDEGHLVQPDRALLVLLDLVAAERRSGRIALPVTTTRIAEVVTRFHGTQVLWTTTAPDDLARAARSPDVVFAGDGRGGFVLPEFSPALDGIAAFVRLLGLVARTRLRLSQIDARIPLAHLVHRSVPTPWAVKASVMRAVVEAAAGHELDTLDGVRVVEHDGGWALVLPDPSEAVTHVWAEGRDAAMAARLVTRWAETVEAARG